MILKISIAVLFQFILNANGEQIQLVNITVDQDCIKLRDAFASASAQFTLCSIENSRPITLCERCIRLYIELRETYKNMAEMETNGTKCIDNFINLDRLQIIQTVYRNNLNLWSKAKCSECFESADTIEEDKQTNKTITFLNFYHDFENCVVSNTVENQLCHNCMDYYVALDTYYKQISNINEEIGSCIDIVDIMNTTWTFWSPRCCIYRRHNEYIFIGSSVGILLITVCFYWLTLFIKEKQAPTIMQQSRFAESFNSVRS